MRPCIIEDKSNVFLIHAMQTYGVSKGICQLILNFGIRWESEANFKLWPLYHQELTVSAQ